MQSSPFTLQVWRLTQRILARACSSISCKPVRACAGESFAGVYIPTLVREVVEGNAAGKLPRIHLEVYPEHTRLYNMASQQWFTSMWL